MLPLSWMKVVRVDGLCTGYIGHILQQNCCISVLFSEPFDQWFTWKVPEHYFIYSRGNMGRKIDQTLIMFSRVIWWDPLRVHAYDWGSSGRAAGSGAQHSSYGSSCCVQTCVGNPAMVSAFVLAEPGRLCDWSALGPQNETNHCYVKC